ncbi:hypothetical protein L596_007179 [Steinernema carpocapsae]|uniref:Uncharacterized protein n=1 Tax=Steinernema carpocapsae TaxID=34508 RepID=A0A4U5P8H3_STECR|nr:hypothetical protein L596_007179 [Steinernema carpocapsae]
MVMFSFHGAWGTYGVYGKVNTALPFTNELRIFQKYALLRESDEELFSVFRFDALTEHSKVALITVTKGTCSGLAVLVRSLPIVFSEDLPLLGTRKIHSKLASSLLLSFPIRASAPTFLIVPIVLYAFLSMGFLFFFAPRHAASNST